MLTVSNFIKAYQGQPVLTLSALHLPAGLHYFQGGNGSGKTTFFRAVAGLLPFSGQITLANQYEINRDSVAYRMRVNYAEAEPLYPPFLTARDLVSFVGKAKHSPAGQSNELAALLGVDQFWTKPTGQFSSGMLKKLSLLLAFLGTPTLILLDEPLTTLDAATVEKLLAYVRQLHAQQNVSFLLTSHQDVTLTDLSLTSTWQVGNGTILPVK